MSSNIKNNDNPHILEIVQTVNKSTINVIKHCVQIIILSHFLLQTP